LICYRGLRPPGNAGRHELILLPIAGEIAAAELGSRIDAEYVVQSNLDGISDVVAVPTATILGNCAATLMLEDVAIDYSLICGISANLETDRLPLVATDSPFSFTCTAGHRSGRFTDQLTTLDSLNMTLEGLVVT